MKRNRTNKAYLGFGYRKVYGWLTKYIVLIFIVFLLSMCIIYMYCFYSQSLMDVNTNEEPESVRNNTEKPHFIGKKYIHLDLKGAPPKVTYYYNYLFPLLAKLGVSGILIEYEDMFPYTGKLLENITALNAYSRDDIVIINNLAKSNGLEIIPLVNTISHLEFVLKLEAFEYLREIPGNPKTICISNGGTGDLLGEMISQIIEAHPDTSMIHIGADEDQYIGRCKKCVGNMRAKRISRQDLFLEHIRSITQFIRKKYQHISILMWDDQFRFLSGDEIRDVEDLNIIPVVSQYDTDVFDKLAPSLWNQYAKSFPKVWFSSAFKGKAGVDQYIVNTAHYLQNHRSWMDIVHNYKYVIQFEAIILSGSQRYDHFSTLCELLPVALPSLIMNLKLLEAREEKRLGPPKQVAEILKCQQPYALMGPTFGTPKCSYLGGEILENMYRLHQLKEDYEHLYKKPEVKGWMGFFNSYYNNSSPEEILKISPMLDHLYAEVVEIEKDVSKALLEVYDAFTKDEWMATYITPLKRDISRLLSIKQRALAKNIWPRKPFNRKIRR